MYLQSLVILEHVCRNYAENTQNQYNDVPRMQHSEYTQIVLTRYNALSSLHKTGYAVLLGKQYDDYTCIQAYVPLCRMRKFYKNSMMEVA